MKMQRREFLHQALAGAGGLVLAPQFLSAQDPPARSFGAFDVVELAKTKIKVSRVGFGTGMRGFNHQSNQTRLGREAFEELLRFSYERGVRLFDMADMYGSHSYVIPALKDIPRKQFVLVTKIWLRPGRGDVAGAGRPETETVVRRFCEEIKTDYIDIVQMHCLTSPKWPEELADCMNDLEKLKKKGVIRAHGLSCHSLEALARVPEEPWVDVVHARINHSGAKMDARPDRVVPVLRKIHDAGKAIIGMKLIGEGDFRQSDEMRNQALDFVLNLGCVDAMIVGFEKKWEIDDFAARVKNVKPRPKVVVA